MLSLNPPLPQTSFHILSILVLGEVRGFDKVHRNLQVSAIKIANLSKLGNCEVLKSMWRNENTEARKLEKNCLLFKQQ